MELRCDICTSRKNGACRGLPYETCEAADKNDAEVYQNAADRIDKDRHPTHKYSSRQVQRREEAIKDARPNQPEKPRQIDAATANRRYLHLKAWRLEESRKRNVPAFYIFTDRDLHALAATDMQCKADLLRVSGVGTMKFNLYGEAVFHILSSVT